MLTKTRSTSVLAAVATVAVLAAASALPAAPIIITNHSFEADTASPPAGWAGAGGGAQATGASDGTNGLWVFSGPISQSLTETFSANTTYTMSVDVIDRPSVNTGWDFGLYYDDGGTLQPVAAASGGPYNGGGYVQKDATTIVAAGDPSVGENIVVALNRRAASASSDWYDNVRLDAGAAPVALTTSLSATAPTDDVAIQQPTSNGNAPWRFTQPAGSDNNPRDAGQTFLVGPDGLVLDKITVRLDTLATTGFDSGSFTLGLYEFFSASDVVPDPDKDSPIFTQTGLLPASLKSDFDAGADYLTIDLEDQTLAAGQYGFLLMLDAPSGSTGDNMLLAIQTDEASYADGIAIRRRNRGTGSDAFSAQTFWTGSADNNLDMEFYLQAAPQAVIPEPSTFALAALGLIGLVGFARRRRRY